MTLEDWLDSVPMGDVPTDFQLVSNRKLHLLAAAFLRRVWGQLPSDHDRRAVEATERFADGRITADALAWARSQSARESGECLWFAGISPDEYHLLEPWAMDPHEADRLARYEWKVAKQGGVLDGVRRAIELPAVAAVGAAFAAYWLENPNPLLRSDPAVRRCAWRSLFTTVREVLGDDGAADAFDPEWRTGDVRALARYIYDHQAFDVLPILADALQDAGCDDATVLDHCRRPGGHVRGCWVVDAAGGR